MSRETNCARSKRAFFFVSLMDIGIFFHLALATAPLRREVGALRYLVASGASSRAASARALIAPTSDLHIGQLLCPLSHLSTHFAWKRCAHGSVLISSPSSASHRHTAQCGGSFADPPSVRARYVRVGKPRIADADKPPDEAPDKKPPSPSPLANEEGDGMASSTAASISPNASRKTSTRGRLTS